MAAPHAPFTPAHQSLLYLTCHANVVFCMGTLRKENVQCAAILADIEEGLQDVVDTRLSIGTGEHWIGNSAAIRM